MAKDNILLHYMQSRLKKEDKTKKAGPVITISREVGCPAKAIASELVNLLNQEAQNNSLWSYLSNEILLESARSLKVDPEYIKHIFTYEDRNMLDEILVATRKEYRYKSDRTIKNTIGQVIRSIGEKGHYVIIGRAGVAHTRHISKSLHTRLYAPLDWRIKKVQEFKNISLDQATQKVKRGDRNRLQFLHYYLGDESLSEYFDLSVNCSSFSVKNVAKMIFEAYYKKKDNISLHIKPTKSSTFSKTF